MPSMNSERSQKAVDVAQRYLRRERPLIPLVVVLAWSVFLGTYLLTALGPAVLVATILIISFIFYPLLGFGCYQYNDATGSTESVA